MIAFAGRKIEVDDISSLLNINSISKCSCYLPGIIVVYLDHTCVYREKRERELARKKSEK